jgi:hypothetical protein
LAGRYNNPFQAIDVVVPVEYHEDVSRYSQKESGSKPINNPFPRMVDVWFLALCLAAKRGLKPAEMTGRATTKIVEGSILSSDQWRVHTLMLVALAYSDGVDIATEPRKMMSIANGLAAAGFPTLFEMLKDGEGDPLWNASEGVEKILRASTKAGGNGSSERTSGAASN